MFCGGFRSDMGGTKAVFLESHCLEEGYAYTRFDYRGHGESSGDFTDGTIGLWRDDTLLALDEATDGPVALVGSSMGAWIALLAALARPARVRGLVLVAPALDFTEELIWKRLPDNIRTELTRNGLWERPSVYTEEPDRITMKLIEEGRGHLLSGGPISFSGPVRILHGMADETVPWSFATRTAELLEASDVVVTLVKDGDHRLSDDANLKRLSVAVDEVISVLAS